MPNRRALEEIVLRELHAGLWHMTHRDRYTGILINGNILPEPDIPDHERWKTARGKEFYPYVRTLRGVSLFDFEDFDPASYSEKYRMCSWREFVPYRADWGCAVWIEIDREQVAPPKFIPASDLRDRWNSEKAYQHTIMPYIEAAYLGPLPRTTFKRAFRVCEGDSELQPLFQRR